MNMRRNFSIPMIVFVAMMAVACTKRMPDNLIPIGAEASNLETDSLFFKEIKYRTIEFISSNKLVESNIDFVDLVLEAQTKPIKNSAVLIGVLKCVAPQVRDGFPSVRCYAGNSTDSTSTDIILVGDKDIRSKLLNLGDNKKGGYLVGRILRFYDPNTLMFYVK